MKLKINRIKKNKFKVLVKNKGEIIEEVAEFEHYCDAKEICDILRKRDDRFNV